MNFEDRLNKIISDHAANKKALAREIGMPYSTFLYKCKAVENFNIIEFRKLSSVLRLTEEEQAFLCSEVACE